MSDLAIAAATAAVAVPLVWLIRSSLQTGESIWFVCSRADNPFLFWFSITIVGSAVATAVMMIATALFRHFSA